MAEYIERESALKEISRYSLNGSSFGRHSGAVDCAMADIERLPPADVAPVKRSNWQRVNDGTHFCNNCGHNALYKRVYDSDERIVKFIEIAGACCTYCGSCMDLEG